MGKQIETITCVDCPYCGYKILATWRTEKKLSEIGTYERGQRSLNDHIKLHEESKKYRWLCDHVRRMAEITGDLKYDT
jgi:DNA-directed RNA polymerase subunit RPC12/RpoP